MMDEIRGKLKVVVFHNDENLYSVIKIKISDESDNKYMTLTGNFPIPNENNEVICMDKDSQTITYDGIANWRAFCRTYDIIHWIYVDDLLPKKGGEQ